MKSEQFMKIVGNKYKYTSDGEYVFHGLVSSQFDEHHIGESLMFSAVKEGETVDEHIVWAENASIWKTDGQRFCVHVFIHDKVQNICYLRQCLTSFILRDLKKDTRTVKNSEYNRELADIYNMYPDQISVLQTDENGEEYGITFRDYLKQKESEKISEKAE